MATKKEPTKKASPTPAPKPAQRPKPVRKPSPKVTLHSKTLSNGQPRPKSRRP